VRRQRDRRLEDPAHARPVGHRDLELLTFEDAAL
jgi:hypothetical protein